MKRSKKVPKKPDADRGTELGQRDCEKNSKKFSTKALRESVLYPIRLYPFVHFRVFQDQN